jgi:hypothetical protein
MAKKRAEGLDLGLVAAVARLVEIAEVRLAYLDVKGPESVDQAGGIPGPLSLEQDFRADAKAEEQALRVLTHFDLALRAPEGPGKKARELVRLKAGFALRYHLPAKHDLSPEHLEAFAQVNGAYNAWPYWRELVQSTLARMGLPPVTIPVFKVPRVEAAAAGEPVGKGNGRGNGKDT